MVYVFDSWLRKIRNKLKGLGISVLMQYHDELLFVCLKKDKKIAEEILKQSMIETNVEVKLNVKISISIDWGNNYAQCH